MAPSHRSPKPRMWASFHAHTWATLKCAGSQGRYPSLTSLFTIHTFTVRRCVRLCPYQPERWSSLTLSFRLFRDCSKHCFPLDKHRKQNAVSITTLLYQAAGFTLCVSSICTMCLIWWNKLIQNKSNQTLLSTLNRAPSIWKGTKLFSEFACTKAIKAWQHFSFRFTDPMCLMKTGTRCF